MRKIILAGGGTAEHVTPNLALLPSLKGVGREIRYIGSYRGMGRKLIESVGIHYDGISSGKLRRYFDIRNSSNPSRVVKGYVEAGRLLKHHKPDIILPGGGFVAVPVVLAAKHYKILVIIHESDMTPGPINRVCVPSALKICYNFSETLKYLPSDRVVLTNSPIREELLQGDRPSELTYAHLTASKPVPPVIGGGLGFVAVNTAARSILPRFLPSYQVIHIYGKGNLDENLVGTAGYVQHKHIGAPLKHPFATADPVISRAGVNSIRELLALRKPNLLIPLSAAVSRGDQILNADFFVEQGFSKVLGEEALSDDSPLDAINDLYLSRSSCIQSMEQSNLNSAVRIAAPLIEPCMK